MSVLLRGITSNHAGDFYCLNCFHSYSTKEKLKKHGKVSNDQDYGYVEMPDKDNRILKYNHGEKLLKAPFIIYADLECLLEKMHSCQFSICFLDIHCLQIVHLMQLKINLIVTEAKIAWKSFVKI